MNIKYTEVNSKAVDIWVEEAGSGDNRLVTRLRIPDYPEYADRVSSSRVY